MILIADSIRLRGTWEVANKSIENEWIIVGFDDEICLTGLHEQLKSGDSKHEKTTFVVDIRNKSRRGCVLFQLELAVQNNISQMMMKDKHLEKLLDSLPQNNSLEYPNGG